LSPARLTGFL